MALHRHTPEERAEIRRKGQVKAGSKHKVGQVEPRANRPSLKKKQMTSDGYMPQ